MGSDQLGDLSGPRVGLIDRAAGRRHRRDGDHDDLGEGAHTRDRHPQGARRREILWQFLLEAVFLTAIGDVLGILLGSAVEIGVHFATDFPISLPWWSFAIGIGFSASVGILFGLFPAIRASGLDPIERHCATSRPPALP